ncbi:hypothetical protein [Streptomyces sp. LARHCF252]
MPASCRWGGGCGPGFVDAVLEHIAGVLELVRQPGGLGHQDAVRLGGVAEREGTGACFLLQPVAALLSLRGGFTQLAGLVGDPVVSVLLVGATQHTPGQEPIKRR